MTIKFHLLSSLLIFFIHCFMVSSYAMTVRNLTSDQHALLAFKHQIIDPHNILPNNWSTNYSLCNWVGLSCDANHNRVTALDLSNMDLTGTIPPQLGNLSFLLYLNLSHNNLHGHLPRELGGLSRLKLIDLSFNFLNGEIPSRFGKLDKVVHLILQYNNLTGVIPPSIGNMSSLENLNLNENLIQGNIPHEISKLLNLRILRLAYNRLSGSIPITIYNMSSLNIISLGFNHLSGGLPEDICRHLPNLEILYLLGNKLSGQIPVGILDECMNLLELYLNTNRFNGNIPRSTGNLTRLQELSLSENDLEGQIPRSIGNLTRLKRLDLGDNNLKGELPLEIGNLKRLERLFAYNTAGLVGFIPPSIFNLSSLQVISLANNTLTGKLPEMSALSNLEKLYLWGNHLSRNIPDSISNASNLRILELEKNSFSGLIPNSLGNLRLLETLNLLSNDLTTKTSIHESSLFDSLANCKYLRFLDLSFNPLNAFLPTSISNLSTSLQRFRANTCKIRGNIPIEIGSLDNAIILDLSNNELTGSIPATIGKLKNIQVLGFSGNNLQGSIPHQLCSLKRLYWLSLATNELDGSLPACLGDSTSIRYLDLTSNKLHSTIPSNFWSLKDILQVDLSSNYFNGSLPLDIGNWKVITLLNLSRNCFSGHIPPTFGSLHDLQGLFLSHNRLQGPIPESFGDLLSLSELDLSNNNLSGLIPKSLEGLSYLESFDVSFNRLEGEIPNGGCFVNFTAKSFMNNFALCGSPTLQLEPCKNQHSNKGLVRSMKYVLPIFGSIILVAAFIIVYRKWQTKRTSFTIVEDLVLVKEWRRISYYQLSEGTGGFNESNLLGSGGFGAVYKGILSDGTEVAIKVFNLQTEGGSRSFDVECEVMSKIIHRNLVKIITCCSTTDFKALVLEFMPNGSLEKWLYSENRALDILQRINIMIDVASALEYLHSEYSVPIIHCDLKPSNVLLDKDMVAHVGDFGIAKLLGEEDSIKQTMTVATIGYMAPEYGSAGIISIKSDVYSYGILLMETFTRKKPTDETFTGEMSLKHWVKMSLSNGINGVWDSSMVQEEDEYFIVKANCISSIMELALECSAELPENRIDMKNIVSKLKNFKRNLLINIGED